MKEILKKIYYFLYSFDPTVIKKELFNKLWRWKLKQQGVTLGNNVTFEGPVEIGNGKNIKIGNNVKLGKEVTLAPYKNGFLEIGNNTYIGRYTIIIAYEKVIIGAHTLISPFNYIIDLDHGMAKNRLIREQQYNSKPIYIGNDVWIGVRGVVLKGVTIGDGAIIGGGGVVTNDIPRYAIAVGVPARVVKKRE